MKILKTVKKILVAISYFGGFIIPSFLVFVSLIALTIATNTASARGDSPLEQLFIYYITIIGLCIALSGTIFSYSSVCDNQNKKDVIVAGEYFLHASLSMIVALSLVFAPLLFDYLVDIKLVNQIFSLFGSIFVVNSAISIHNGLIGIEKYLYLKNKR
ncbi:hypothetical protein KAJ61_05905 [Candidatus Parcubacteria bacterium]|nr:hypothetical protein [Candidatus Parcubacteria bacterium]